MPSLRRSNVLKAKEQDGAVALVDDVELSGSGAFVVERTGHGLRKAKQPQALLVTDVALQTTAALGMDRGKQCSLMPAGDGCGTADHSRTGHGRRKAMQPHACW
ncbi:hypothetical protein NDU88_009248 [Pleurodeles waltl]|uniref:Uncharacterized protein n=1 Tax=Pleurodeles waltl TaxID=8319 RepID=A0AAV7P1V8_PLEWA|nr:hypothetical protein NDU88_009248 [Pleurodeles waltl]